MEGDERGSALVGGNRELAAENIRAMTVTSAEMETESESTITVDLCHVDEEVELRASAPKAKSIETVESRETTVDALGPDNTAPSVPGGSGNTAVAVPDVPDYTAVDVLGQSDHARVDLLEKPYNVNLDADGEITVDAVKESNNKTLDALMESGDVADVLGESMAIGVLDAVPTTFDYDMMDLDAAEGENSAEANVVEMPVREGDSIEPAVTHFKMSQHSISPSFGNLGGWQVVSWPRTALQDGRQGWGTASLKLSKGIDRKDLLQGWDWVFQRK